MFYLAILIAISLLVSIYLISSAEDKCKSAVVYGTKEEALKAKKKLDVLFNRCVFVSATLFLIVLYIMIK